MRGAPLIVMLVWLDCETTGLGDECKLLEVGLIVTDDDLQEQTRLSVALTIPPGPMAEWSWKVHNANGLLDACRARGVPPHVAEAQILGFLKCAMDNNSSAECKLTAAGSSVWGDLILLKRWMPVLHVLFGHRVVDVTTLLLLCQRWSGPQPPKPRRSHRALDDCDDSIALLRFYRLEWLDT